MNAREMTTGTSPIEMLEKVVLSIIDDDSFALLSQQSKLC